MIEIKNNIPQAPEIPFDGLEETYEPLDFKPDKKIVGHLISANVFKQIKNDLDNLPVYTIHTSIGPYKSCVEFKSVINIINKYCTEN